MAHAQRRLSTQLGIAPATNATTEQAVVLTPSMYSAANTMALVAAATMDPIV